MSNDEQWEKQLEQLPLGHGGFTVQSMNKIKERIRMNQSSGRRSIRITVATAAILLTGVIAWALSRGEQPGQKTALSMIDETEGQLIVEYWDSQSFMGQIGQPYLIRHPNMKLKVATLPSEISQRYDWNSYKEWMVESAVDVVQVPLAYIDDLAKDGAIVPLDNLLELGGIDLSEMYQPMLELAREAGGGKLYALPDQFNLELLYYNKTLFQSHNVPLPEAGDTWDDIFRLAERFAGATATNGRPVYGLSIGWRSNPYSAISKIGRAQGLSLVDAKGMPQVNSEAWQALWRQATEGLAKGWINNEPGPEATGNGWTEQSMIEADPFINNRSAMSFQSYSAWSTLSKAGDQGLFSGDWDVLPISSNAASPGITSSYSGGLLYAINAKSPNRDQAMQLIESIVSKERAEREYASGIFSLHANRPSSLTVLNDPADRFYATRLDAASILEQFERNQLPGVIEMSSALNAIGNESTEAIIAGRSTVEDTLAHMQEEAERIIHSARGSGANP